MLTECLASTLPSGSCIPLRTFQCSIRNQGEQCLVYNSKTDELHLISPLAAYILELCDGLNSFDDLVQMFSPSASHRDETTQLVGEFLLQMADRGVLEVRS